MNSEGPYGTVVLLMVGFGAFSDYTPSMEEESNMSGKTYSERGLLAMLDVATEYIEDSVLRDLIISKCHQGIGWLVTSSPEHERAGLDLSQDETTSLAAAVRRRKRAISKQKVVKQD